MTNRPRVADAQRGGAKLSPRNSGNPGEFAMTLHQASGTEELQPRSQVEQLFDTARNADTTSGAALLRDVVDVDLLESMYRQKYVSINPHPELPLYILNYTNKAQGERVWNACTVTCRGLVVESETGAIVARPFRKFFNWNENVPEGVRRPDFSMPHSIYEKVDGSLGILFFYRGDWHISTRGGFQSSQALWAGKFIRREGIREKIAQLDPDLTWLAEIVFAQNRICVSYQAEGLVLLGAVRTHDGLDVPLEEVAPMWDGIGRTAQTFSSDEPLEELARRVNGQSLDIEGNPRTGSEIEGYVVRFTDGSRTKIKLGDYERIARMLMRFGTKDIFQCAAFDSIMASDSNLTDKYIAAAIHADPRDMPGMRSTWYEYGTAFGDMFGTLPDDISSEIIAIRDTILSDAQELLSQARSIADRLAQEHDGDMYRAHVAANSISDGNLRGLAHEALSGKNIVPSVWRVLVRRLDKYRDVGMFGG